MKLHHGDERVTLWHGDALEVLRELADNSVDAVVTDPPYGLGFMGREWDDLPPGLPWAQECFRVLKPGGHLLAFGGTRTWHRLACAVEDAGFEVRDSIAWLYGSGFPKSLDVSKAIDKHLAPKEPEASRFLDTLGPERGRGGGNNEWSGWGTALKPAFEPVVVARKPLTGTVAATVLQHGTGALNIDACRVGDGGGTTKGNPPKGESNGIYGNGINGACDIVDLGKGRWPTNVVLDDSQAAELDEQSGESAPKPARTGRKGGCNDNGTMTGYGTGDDVGTWPADAGGGASRFFPTFRYEAKAPTSERPRVNGTAHPTVKPLDLMRWLVRLVTPPGGTVLEPFAGSGTTVEACIVEGFHCIAIEREADYLPLIMQRVNRRRDPVAYIKAAGDDLGLFDLEELA